jgi:glucose-1-phosphate adenylyltransferase
MRKGGSWYEGTADAIYQNLWLLTRSDAKYVVVLSGDHIYKMDYAAMLEEHIAKIAITTVACMEVPRNEASAFGIINIDTDFKITSFVEKPKDPPPLPNDPNRSLASMGVYIFNMEELQDALTQDAEDENSSHDFGKDVLPKLISTGQVYAYNFFGDKGRVAKDCYWRDVGTIDSYYRANMDLLEPLPPMNIYQKDWAIRTYEAQFPPARTVSSATGNEGIFINSIISNGVINSGGSVHHSIISANVQINDSATVTGSIIFDDVTIGEGCQIANCIIDKHVKIPPNTEIGIDHEKDAQRFHISEQGIVVVPEAYQFD